MAEDLAKLNRLRVNAGKPELKSWKAPQHKLEAAIKKLEEEGYVDVVAGANVEAKPLTNDPEVAAARAEPEAPPSLADSALSKNVSNGDKPAPKVTNGKAHLARGLDTDTMARQSRAKVRDIRENEKKQKKEEAAKLSPEDKKQIKEEGAARNKLLSKGQVDPKKDPAKAKRQEEHIKAKQEARAKAGKTTKPKEKSADEITLADIAREFDEDPKIIRAKARRHEAKLIPLHSKGQDRWSFPIGKKAEIIKILSLKK